VVEQTDTEYKQEHKEQEQQDKKATFQKNLQYIFIYTNKNKTKIELWKKLVLSYMSS
jgi:hypothetical protein